MNCLRWLLLVAVFVFVPAHAQLPAPGEPGAVNDFRYCGEPARTVDGKIKRSRTTLREFAKTFACPANLLPVPSCPGWAIDHVIPLVSGGCDSTINMQWLPDSIKSCAQPNCKDRWERAYHAQPRRQIGTP